MLASNLNLLLHNIAVDFDSFHPVEQRRRDGGSVVGGSDEEHLGQVVVGVDIVVVEMAVLLRVEHFEKCRGGVAFEILTHLVDFVKYDDGIRRSALDKSVDDAAGHRAYVGATVSAYLGLVVETAERDSGIFAPEGFGHRAA